MTAPNDAPGTQIDLDPDFAVRPGQVPQPVIDELRQACRTAADFTQAFGDACKAQAEKYKIKPKALRRYITALEGDKLDEAEAEAEDLQALIEAHEPT
jgi:hypothetical protein